MVDASLFYQKALEHRYSANYEQSELLLKQGIRKFPDDTRFILDFCKLAMNKKQWRIAIQRFEQFKDRVKQEDYFIFYSICYERLGDFEGAKKIVKYARTRFVNSLELLLNEIRLDFEELISGSTKPSANFIPSVLSEDRLSLVNSLVSSSQSEKVRKQVSHLLWLFGLYKSVSEETWLLNISGTGFNSGRFGLVNSTGGLYLPRLADDWVEEKHGITIARQLNLEKGDCLALLKANPHPVLANILDFDRDSVLVEHVEGVIFSNENQYAPKQWTNSFVSQNDKSKWPSFVQLQGVINHLHSIGVAHTDFTDYNIMVSNSGGFKLIDLLGCMPLDERLRRWDLIKLNSFYKYYYS